MKVATTDLNIPLVPQEGRNADAIRGGKQCSIWTDFGLERLFGITADLSPNPGKFQFPVV